MKYSDDFDFLKLSLLFSSACCSIHNPPVYKIKPSSNAMSKFKMTGAMEVTSGKEKSIFFVSVGEPPVQERPRVVWRGRRTPTIYDPSARKKADYARALKHAMTEIGSTWFPAFDKDILKGTKGLTLTVEFYLHRNLGDYCFAHGQKILKEDCDDYPKGKDIDNMVKFIMDALHLVIYDNDTVITKILTAKEFVPESRRDRPAWTNISIETRF
jgi:Holliday junction resolvase RusA-like endonuclease